MQFIIVITFVLLVFLFYRNTVWEAAVFVYTGFIMLYSMLPAGEELFGFIDHKTLVVLIAIIGANFARDIHVSKADKNQYLKIAITFLILTLSFGRFIDIKEELINHEFELFNHMKRIIRDVIYAYAFILILKRINDPKTVRSIENGLVFGMSLGILSMLFYDLFIDLGFHLHVGTTYFSGGRYFEGDDLRRQTGFFGQDSNTAGALFNVVIGYVYAKNERSQKFSLKHIYLFMLSVIGLLTVASKSGLIVLSLITILFIARSSRSFFVGFRKVMIFAVIGFVLYQNFGALLTQRVEQQISGEVDTFTGRAIYWQMYIDDIIDNPEYLLIGNLGNATYERDVHNNYIHILFYGGLPYLLITLYLFWLIFRRRNMYNGNQMYFTPLYFVVVLAISWTTGAGQISYWFMLLIVASEGTSLPINSQNRDPIDIIQNRHKNHLQTQKR